MATATIQKIDELYAGRILCPKTVVIGNLLTLTPLFGTILGAGIIAATFYFGITGDLMENPDRGQDRLIAGALFAIGLAIASTSAFWGMRNISRLGNWYLRRVARTEVVNRPDRLVHPDDPDAIFVELVPRANWKRLMLETATDIGYLLVDEAKGELLFEGDKERMRLPADAILAVEAEETRIGDGTMKYYFTVLEVDCGQEVRELPFAYRGDMGQLGASVREERSVALRDRIDRLPRL